MCPRSMATGYRAPEPIKVKARDGVTDLYGAIWKPNSFDSTKVYPVIDNIYPGPQLTTGPKRFMPHDDDALTVGYSQYSQVKALAELGFIVVNVDAIGTTHRSKAFRETWYANMGDNGLPDHITALKQLAATRPYMDLTRVGIYGISGGGFASTDAILRYPEFFKVAVSTSGNHDNRSYNMHWGEKYTGVLTRDTVRKTDNFESQSNPAMAANLRGKLFLIHGDMDDNVSPVNTLRLRDALIKAGKTFDMLIVPDAGHMMYYLPYVHRVHWDLLRAQPAARGAAGGLRDQGAAAAAGVTRTAWGCRNPLSAHSLTLTRGCEVGATGFEPATSCSRSRRATGLRYAPKFLPQLIPLARPEGLEPPTF